MGGVGLWRKSGESSKEVELTDHKLWVHPIDLNIAFDHVLVYEYKSL